MQQKRQAAGVLGNDPSRLPWTRAIRIPEPPPATPACRDPHDSPFLHLAFAGKADALMSGDADLLTLAPLQHVALLTPAQAIEWLGSA